MRDALHFHALQIVRLFTNASETEGRKARLKTVHLSNQSSNETLSLTRIQVDERANG